MKGACTLVQRPIFNPKNRFRLPPMKKSTLEKNGKIYVTGAGFNPPLTGLALRILEACSGALAAIFFAFLDARVAGKETGPFQDLPVFRIEFQERFGNTVPNGPCLAGNPSPKHIDGYVQFAERPGKHQRLSNYHFARFPVQIRIGRLSVYNYPTGSGLKPNSRD